MIENRDDRRPLEPLRTIEADGLRHPMVEAGNLGKIYSTGDALRDVNFRLRTGEVCGLVGPNGSGKTTLLRILATLLGPSLGTARVDGFDVRKDGAEVRRRIGFMPDAFGGDQELTVDGYLEFFARIWRIPPHDSLRTIEDILNLVDLIRFRNVPIGRLSLGARQRLSIARVLVHNPSVLLLDEPVSGLDPRGRAEMRGLLRELGRLGKTILISSHILADLADLCGRLAILARGRLVFFGTLAELKRVVSPERWIEVAVEADLDRARDFISRQPWARGLADGKAGALRVSLGPDGVSPADISAALVAAGFRLTRFLEVDVDLEEAFIRITGEERR